MRKYKATAEDGRTAIVEAMSIWEAEVKAKQVLGEFIAVIGEI